MDIYIYMILSNFTKENHLPFKFIKKISHKKIMFNYKKFVIFINLYINNIYICIMLLRFIFNLQISDF